MLLNVVDPSVIEIINNFGFPVFCCIALGWYIVKRQDSLEKRTYQELDKQSKRIDKLFDRLNDTMLKVSNALNDNTEVLSQCKKLFNSKEGD